MLIIHFMCVCVCPAEGSRQPHFKQEETANTTSCFSQLTRSDVTHTLLLTGNVWAWVCMCVCYHSACSQQQILQTKKSNASDSHHPPVTHPHTHVIIKHINIYICGWIWLKRLWCLNQILVPMWRQCQTKPVQRHCCYHDNRSVIMVHKLYIFLNQCEWKWSHLRTCSTCLSASGSRLIGATIATLQGAGPDGDWRFLGGSAGGLRTDRQTDRQCFEYLRFP